MRKLIYPLLVSILVAQVHLQLPGNKSIVEVAVDAGTGKVLSQKRESAKAQSAEKAADAAAANNRKWGIQLELL